MQAQSNVFHSVLEICGTNCLKQLLISAHCRLNSVDRLVIYTVKFYSNMCFFSLFSVCFCFFFVFRKLSVYLVLLSSGYDK